MEEYCGGHTYSLQQHKQIDAHTGKIANWHDVTLFGCCPPPELPQQNNQNKKPGAFVSDDVICLIQDGVIVCTFIRYLRLKLNITQRIKAGS